MKFVKVFLNALSLSVFVFIVAMLLLEISSNSIISQLIVSPFGFMSIFLMAIIEFWD